MTGANFRSFAFAGLMVAGSFFMGISGASSTPAATGIASSGFSDIAREASNVTDVRRRGGRRWRGGGRRWRGGGRRWRGGGRRWRRGRRWGYGGFYGGPFIGFGAPYYYGGYYPYYDDYSSGYDDYYYRPRVRRAYRGSRSCRRTHRACIRNWGYGGGNYRGCMRYDRCRPR